MRQRLILKNIAIETHSQFSSFIRALETRSYGKHGTYRHRAKSFEWIERIRMDECGHGGAAPWEGGGGAILGWGILRIKDENVKRVGNKFFTTETQRRREEMSNSEFRKEKSGVLSADRAFGGGWVGWTLWTPWTRAGGEDGVTGSPGRRVNRQKRISILVNVPRDAKSSPKSRDGDAE